MTYKGIKKRPQVYMSTRQKVFRLVISCQLSAISSQLSAISSQLSAISSQLSAISSQCQSPES